MEVPIKNGQGRIDLAIDYIGIEIKGPTTNAELSTLPVQCGNYSGDYKKIIVVMFKPEFGKSNFDQIRHIISKSYPDLTIRYIRI
jgi:hypothetical protein